MTSPTRSPRSPDHAALHSRLRAMAESIDAPDVVIAYSRDGERTVCTGGSRALTAADAPRARMQYEAGSVSKTFTGLLLAALVEQGKVRNEDLVYELLGLPPTPYGPHRGRSHRDRITLLHLITHTSGLPRLPYDFYPRALPRWSVNPYALYGRRRMVDAFARSDPRRAPGTHWNYSNFGVGLLAPALERATATPFAELLDRYVLAPLNLRGTGIGPDPGLPQAAGHRRGGAPLPAWDVGGWAAAGGIHSTPDDLLSYVEAHLRPDDTPAAGALRAVQTPLLARGRRGRREEHTLTWFRHRTDNGAALFHNGATCGQHLFIGYRPSTRTALVALATRRHTHRSTLIPAAYELLTDDGQ
jgi:CubicO group peptidase (beta-lactamase class C family)